MLSCHPGSQPVTNSQVEFSKNRPAGGRRVLPKAPKSTKTTLFHKGHAFFKKSTRRRPPGAAEGTKMVENTPFSRGTCIFQKIDPPEAAGVLTLAFFKKSTRRRPLGYSP